MSAVSLGKSVRLWFTFSVLAVRRETCAMPHGYNNKTRREIAAAIVGLVRDLGNDRTPEAIATKLITDLRYAGFIFTKRPRATRPTDRFMAYVSPEPNTGCWLWAGATCRRYGVFYNHAVRRQYYAHRWSYEAAMGPIPNTLTVDHLCCQPLCVNPEHLELVTLSENVRRANDTRRKRVPQQGERLPANRSRCHENSSREVVRQDRP